MIYIQNNFFFLGIIIKHYGSIGFFFVVFGLTLFGSIVNRGAFVSPLKPIESFIYGKIKLVLFFLFLLNFNCKIFFLVLKSFHLLFLQKL